MANVLAGLALWIFTGECAEEHSRYYDDIRSDIVDTINVRGCGIPLTTDCGVSCVAAGYMAYTGEEL